MAGSWKHMTTGTGRLRNNETFSNMLENGGDCYEAAQECFGMVHYLADRMAALTQVGGWVFVQRTREDLVAEAQANYKTGLALGGVQADGEEDDDDEGGSGDQ